MIGEFHLAIVEPVAWEQELDRLIASLGWGKGLPVAEVILDRDKVKRSILTALQILDEDGDPNQIKSIEDKILNRKEHFFVKLPVSSWDAQDYSDNFRKSEESDIFVCSNSSKVSSRRTIKAKSTLNHPLLLGKNTGSFDKGGDGITNLLDPIIKTGSQFMIVDYIFGREIKLGQDGWGNWQSIINLIKKIWDEKQTTGPEACLDASIELHTSVDPTLDREKVVDKIKSAIPVGCEIKFFSWQCLHFNRFYKEKLKNDQPQPHERMFLTESIGITIENGFRIGGNSDWSLHDLSKIDDERKKYTPGNDKSFMLHWFREISKKRIVVPHP